MSRNSNPNASGSIRRNSPVNSSQDFNKYSEQFLKQRIKNRQKIQNRMKNLNIKLNSSQSDLVKQLNLDDNPEIGLQQRLARSPRSPRSPERTYLYERPFEAKQMKQPRETQQAKVLTQEATAQLLAQLKQTYQSEISSLKRAHELKLKAAEQVVHGKDKIIKELQIQNGVLKTQLTRLEGCLKSGRLF